MKKSMTGAEVGTAAGTTAGIAAGITAGIATAIAGLLAGEYFFHIALDASTLLGVRYECSYSKTY